MSISSAQNGQSSRVQPEGMWPPVVSYLIQPIAAALAILFPFRHLVIKSAEQTGLAPPRLTILEGLKGGMGSAPNIGLTVGVQMILKRQIEEELAKKGVVKNSPLSMLVSSASVGILSAPILALFNGKTLGLGWRASLRNFSPQLALAFACQETAFMGGFSAASYLACRMKDQVGESKTVEYTAAFIGGAVGSLIGHPANTAVTRWQSGLKIDSLRQLGWGAARKAYAIGVFCVLYKLGQESFGSFFESK